MKRKILFAALLLTVAAALRLTNVNWDQYQHVHPDERFIVWVADTISWPGDLRVALDPARSTIDPFRWPPGSGEQAGQPRSYAYGHFPLYLLVIVAHAAQAAGTSLAGVAAALPPALQPLIAASSHLADYDQLSLVGRVISALFDLGTLLLVFALGRRAYGEKVGAVAAAAYGCAVLPIQLSHFFGVDIILTFCIVATIALAARYAERGGRWTWLAAGAMAGLAVGSKFSAILLAIPLFAAALYRLPDGTRLRTLAVRLATGAIAAAVAFVLTNPFAIIELRAFTSNILEQNSMVSGFMDAPYTRQYIGTLPYWYFIQQLSQWGLGWPLGSVAWAGLVWAITQALRKRETPAQAVMLTWALPYFATAGAFEAKFLRYMEPLLPFLLIFGSGMLFAAHRWLTESRPDDALSPRKRRWLTVAHDAWPAVLGIVAVFTVGWALAFTGVYRQEHPWLQASRWIYDHVPADSRLLSEHWDDSLPLAMDELRQGQPHIEYQRAGLPLWDPDTPEKLQTLVDRLSTADYVTIASNRLSRPMPRLGARYPMSSHYYDLLFSGALGYQRVAEFAVYPRLGPLVIPDDNADESFTVYDHPHALVFVNAERLSPELLRARLGRFLPAAESTNQPATGHKAPGHALEVIDPTPAPPLTLSQPVDELPVVSDFRWNGWASGWPPAAVVLWWLALSAIGWLTWPLLFALFPGLRDRGYGLARIAGWVLVGWVNWMGASLGLWENRVGALAALLGGLALLGLLAGYRQRRRLAAFWAAHRRLLLAEEALFGLAFLAFVGIRLLDPDLWQPWNGGEKFMEFAFLNATLRSAHFPPYDPYFAGGTINYYYYGLYLVSVPIKLTGIVPEVAFNLAVPGLFALTAVAVFSIAYSLAGAWSVERSGPRPVVVASLAVAFTLLLGNLDACRQLLDHIASLGGNASASGIAFVGSLFHGLGRLVAGTSLPGFDFWAPSRVIPYTINEFPYWTFLFADLHPHMIAMPIGMLVAGLALGWVLNEEERDDGQPAPGRARRALADLAVVCLLVLALGAIGPTNTWDLPVYALLVAGAFWLRDWRRRGLLPALGALLLAAATVALAVGIYAPFYAHYKVEVGGSSGSLLARFLAPVQNASPLGSWLLVWGIFLFVVYSFVLTGEALPEPARLENDAERDGEARPGEQGADVPPSEVKTVDEQTLAEAGPGRAANERLGIEAPLPTLSGTPGFVLMLLGFALAILLVALSRPTAALIALPLAAALGMLFRRQATGRAAFLGLLLTLGLGILFGTELVYLRDFLEGGDWYRMNTVFKFSMPAWLCLGIAAAALLPRLWERGRQTAFLHVLWRVAAAGLLAAGCTFLVFGTAARVDDRFPGPRPAIGTLDGTAFMTVGRYDWPDQAHTIQLSYDYAAIHWLLDHVTGTPVVAEAPAGEYQVDGQSAGFDYYRAGGLRVSSLTGFPTFVGQHQYEQRPGEQVSQRVDLGQEFFSTTDLARTRALIGELHVDYIYVGALERMLFSAESLGKFDTMARAGELQIVYRNEQVTIYRVVAAAR